jgi:hypothetical protein
LAEKGSVARQPYAGSAQPPGFYDSRDNEWEEAARFWNGQTLPSDIAAFFDDYVHDSHAWFKITGTESDDVAAELSEWAEQMDAYDNEAKQVFPYGWQSDPLTSDQRRWASACKLTGKVPAMPTEGRSRCSGARPVICATGKSMPGAIRS